ncbi:PilN domain-containing protein [Variovorax sp. WDL1]|uniref:PilN domain-containing protein n=1 Tax=Variovorax sp. WDL1 TaxID=207745 RepID=UPI0018DB6614|nr:PilN domain-containing protein [Variovorax sp. WDL1]
MAALLLALGVLGGAHSLLQRHTLLAERAAAVAQAEALRPPLHLERSGEAEAFRPEASGEADRLIASLHRPWAPMFDALQSTVTDDVRVTRVQPESDARRLHITGEADNSQAFVAWMQRLQSDASWRSVEPLSEARQAEGAAASGKPVLFRVSVEWRQP